MPGTNLLSDTSNGRDSSFTRMRPEIFMQNLLGYGGENISSTASSDIISIRPDGAGLTLSTSAAVAAGSLLDTEKHNGRIYRLGIRLPLTIKLPRSSLRLS